MRRGFTAPRDVKVFCRVFPDAFFVSDRPPYFDLKGVRGTAAIGRVSFDAGVFPR